MIFTIQAIIDPLLLAWILNIHRHEVAKQATAHYIFLSVCY
jgi:hypothetical protein